MNNTKKILMAAATVLAMQGCQSVPEEPQENYRLQVVFSIDKTVEDPLTIDYQEHKEESILWQAAVRAKEYLAHIGDAYNLPSIDVTFVTQEPLNKDIPTITLGYTTLENLVEKYKDDPEVSMNITTERKIIGTSIRIKNEAYKLQEEGYSQENISKNEVREKYIAENAIVDVHEILHNLGLQHIFTSKRNKSNVMYLERNEENTAYPELNKRQIRQSLNYFK